MRRIPRTFRNRYGKKGLLLMLVGASSVALMGGAVYAALGGSSQPQAAGDIKLQRGLVGHWKLDGNAKDVTPNANNGTIVGATLAADRKAQANRAYAFADPNHEISLPASPALNNSIFTYSAWIYPTNATAGGSVIGSGLAGGPQLKYSAGTGSVRLSLTVQNVVEISFATARAPLGAWSHVAVSYNNTTGQTNWYFNGVLDKSQVEIVETFTFTNFKFGKKHTTVDSFVGSLDEIRMYNRMISTAEVKAIYEQYDNSVRAASGQNGLIGYWKLDGNLKDATPYARHGEMKFGQPALYDPDRKSVANKAKDFDGINKSVDIPGPSGLFAKPDFTISTWLRADNQTTAVYLYGSGIGSGNESPQAKYHASSPAAGTVRFELWSGGSQSSWEVANTIPAVNTWYLITWTKQGNTVSFYRDGQLLNSFNNAPAGAVYTHPTDYSLGYAGSYLAGALDDFRIYDRALPMSEIQRLHQSYDAQIALKNLPAAVEPPDITTGLVGYWPFTGNSNDATPFSNNGTVTGATLAAGRTGAANTAYSFNGTSNYITVPNTLASTPTDKFSLSLWANQTTITANKGMLGRWNYVGGSHGPWALQTSGSNGGSQLRLFISSDVNDGGSNYVDTGIGSWTLGWHHVAVVYDVNAAPEIKIYIDGVLQTLTTSGNPNGGLVYPSTIPAMRIGDFQGLNRFWNGSIDQVRVYNRTLNAGDVQALYSSNN